MMNIRPIVPEMRNGRKVITPEMALDMERPFPPGPDL